MHSHSRHYQAQRITVIGIVKNIFLAVIKIIFGISGQSQALIVDGLHSVADLLTDILVLIAAKYGSQHADSNHPYGHQRIETAATVALAALLIITGAFILFDTVQDLIKARHLQPTIMVLWIAIGSAVINELLFHLTKRVGKRIRSNLLIANAWHHRSDAASSIIVATGVAGALLGYGYLDTVAALMVGILIIKMGAELAWSSIQELVDTGVDEQTLTKMQHIIKTVPGVKSIHQLRNRGMGGSIYVDVHIQVNPFLTVSEGHHIAQQVHHTLMQEMPEVTDVTVHVDPEDDEAAEPSKQLPNRDLVLSQLHNTWSSLPESKSIHSIQLHYLSGHIVVEIKLPLTVLMHGKSPEQLQHQFRQTIPPELQITRLELWFQ